MTHLLHNFPIGRSMLAAANRIGVSYSTVFKIFTGSRCGYEHASFLRRWAGFGYIGDGVHIATSCEIGSPQLAIIGEQAYLGSCTLLAGDSFLDYRLVSHPEDAIVIGDFTTIGDDVIIYPGVTIGPQAKILPGAIITSDVAEGAVIYPGQRERCQPQVGKLSQDTANQHSEARNKALQPVLRGRLNA